ncbi:cytidylate kinase [Dysgonomonas hofstadii]|uniref:Cytidylate kinase n=1 Tax=Dysgonomonas hofstadii TaxID=637886 RepID=A0A840CNS1_9BACT|nr:AAA family ATPase [Dysgonomonas hofstadii]MBB4037650.1 cytidylate kinase [Dysgonomonas hofstadii]
MSSISITGDLGSGKSSVAKLLTEKLGYQYIYTGLMQRKIAEERGMNTLELNYFSEKNKDIDDYIDNYLMELDKAKENYILDSRLAWHFVKSSYKIYLTVKPEIAAQRVFLDENRINEPDAKSIEERISTLQERKMVEVRRFKKLYNIDCLNFENYNLVIDTSYSSVEDICNLIITLFKEKEKDFPRYWVSPKSLYPTEHVRKLGSEEAKNVRDSIMKNGFDYNYPIQVVMYKDNLYIWDGHKRTSGALFNKIPLIPITILARDKEEIHTNHTAEMFVESLNKNFIYDWEDIHDFYF